jgi:hypothetical protein
MPPPLLDYPPKTLCKSNHIKFNSKQSPIDLSAKLSTLTIQSQTPQPLNPKTNKQKPMQQKVTAQRLRDLENIAKILQYIEEANPTPQQLKQKFLKTKN